MRELTCDVCGETFESETTEEEERAEMEQLFGELPPEEQACACHECWLALGFDRIGEA